MEDTQEKNLWGVRVPCATAGPPRRLPPRTLEETQRLVRLLQKEPRVAGRFHDTEISEIEPGSSGVRMVYGTWHARNEPVEQVPAESHTRGAVRATRRGELLPAIVKLGAGEREVHWATQLAEHAPAIYAAGYALGSEPVPWLVMERCPYVIDYAWFCAPWGHRVFTTLMDAGVRFHLTARRIAPPVGPANVGVEWLSGLVRLALTCDPPAPGPRELVERVCGRLERDWEWVLSVCHVELAHGDLHLANAVWRAEPSDPQAKALLLDHTPYALPWALEAAYCQGIYWGGWTRHPLYRTPVHEMAALRALYGLEVPAPAEVDRLAALCVAWQALRLWPTTTRYHGRPQYEAAVARWIEHAARA